MIDCEKPNLMPTTDTGQQIAENKWPVQNSVKSLWWQTGFFFFTSLNFSIKLCHPKNTIVFPVIFNSYDIEQISWSKKFIILRYSMNLVVKIIRRCEMPIGTLKLQYTRSYYFSIRSSVITKVITMLLLRTGRNAPQ